MDASFYVTNSLENLEMCRVIGSVERILEASRWCEVAVEYFELFPVALRYSQSACVVRGRSVLQ